MTDVIDQANDRAELLLSAALYRVAIATPALAANGRCFNCGNPLGQGLRFCDTDCRDDYDHRHRTL